ncbi:COG2426 family protein [Dethiothermospora halolimnae]|uniref:COG2426 family protein n=1 Tax=Dethiothermospora halolimnae TaxID=3114390 RepID=UPI003CCC3D03
MGGIITIFKEELFILLLSAAPISELRGAIPAAITVLGFSPLYSLILGVIGNTIPVPFLLKLLKPLFDFFGETGAFGGIITWIKKRTLKRSDKVKKYSIVGLYLLVAIPLPTTGAWTGCLAATLFNIKFKHAFPAILLGILTSGIIMVLVTTQATWLAKYLFAEV